MPEFGLGGLLMWLVVVTVTIAIPALIVGIGLRLAGIGRVDSRNVLRQRLARGEITQAEFETANRALGQ